MWDLSDSNSPQSWDSFSAGQTGGVLLLLSEDGRGLVTAGLEGAAKVWDLPKQHQRQQREFGGPDKAYAIALSADGRHLATVSKDHKQLNIWDKQEIDDKEKRDPSWTIDFRMSRSAPTVGTLRAATTTG